MRSKKGDTLVEVAIAIGIFSMVAITVVSVTTASTTSAQASLEVTLTREEIDAQADALRFIHNSYVSSSQSKDTTTNPYKGLWGKIVDNAVDAGNIKNYNNTIDYCSKLYNNSGLNTNTDANDIKGTKPFIINTRKLSTFNPDMVVINNGNKFKEATTFPRIRYNNTPEDLYNQAESNNETIASVEGLFVIGFRGGGTNIINKSGNKQTDQGTYFDFYVRSCWMPPGAVRASTISTVIRLYDPAAITY